uniref:Protein disulfide isomerase family A, member 5 n=1 Tax=Fundulus heteroclitus TaxID=8078 RepID=A0A3Q2QRV3_FUNHE
MTHTGGVRSPDLASALIEQQLWPHTDVRILRTSENALMPTSGDSYLKLLSDVAQTVKGQGTIAWVNCGDSEGRKLCKKVKVDPSSKHEGAELLHYKDGTFHTEYNRPATFKSMVAFLKDPSGPPLWEENPEAKDVVHIETEKVSKDLNKLLIYSYCDHKTPVEPFDVLAGMNVHPAEFDGLKQEYNVKGYPTFCYFEKGKFLHHYENYGATPKDIADWLKKGCDSEQKLHPLAPRGSLTETDPIPLVSLKKHICLAVIWVFLDSSGCGHCKKMKPEYDEAAEVLNRSPGVLAAVDATVHKAVGERFKISGFPTVKYFENGEEKYTLPHLRSKDKIIEYMHNPQAPPPPEQSWEDKPSSVSHLGSEDFRDALKKKKHALVMFYAPWCPHCKNAVPHFTTAAELFKEDRKEAGFIGFMRNLRGRDQEKVVKRKEEL